MKCSSWVAVCVSVRSSVCLSVYRRMDYDGDNSGLLSCFVGRREFTVSSVARLVEIATSTVIRARIFENRIFEGNIIEARASNVLVSCLRMDPGISGPRGPLVGVRQPTNQRPQPHRDFVSPFPGLEPRPNCRILSFSDVGVSRARWPLTCTPSPPPHPATYLTLMHSQRPTSPCQRCFRMDSGEESAANRRSRFRDGQGVLLPSNDTTLGILEMRLPGGPRSRTRLCAEPQSSDSHPTEMSGGMKLAVVEKANRRA